MKSILITFLLSALFTAQAQSFKDKLQKKKDSLEKVTKDKLNAVSTTSAAPKLTNEEVIRGLKEALSVGTNSASSLAGKTDGFLKNTRLFIPWPEEAKDMKAKLTTMGFTKKINEFETSLNRAAEQAALKAAPVFIDAITNMSVADGFAILKGNDTAATNFLRKTTSQPLYDKFLPVVKEAVNSVKVTSYWNPLATSYNKLPGVKKQNPDLDDYVTRRAINGLMILISDEEINIRKNPKARLSDLLKKVFGS
ncbi:MAG: DUF4197 domain-containing protein [Bacteroidetes bacterium]|jgi:hypothetical protein|nr:DUF4197 domain-containing protein [Bacteroidota bacterium]MCA6444674.1 DUF4197 domain-containing protein [Bacteroidota bacterium]